MLALALLLAGLAAAEPADPETIKAAKRFVTMEIGDMTPAFVEHMMNVDPTTLPDSLMPKVQARQVELQTMRQLGEGKKKGTVRIPGDDCAIPKEAKSQNLKILRLAGFVEIYDVEVLYLEDLTHCTERKMMCEFSLQLLIERDKKGQAIKRYFLHAKDPLMALVGEYRTRGRNTDTNFFGGKIHPTCSG